jgi:hypothetical protein
MNPHAALNCATRFRSLLNRVLRRTELNVAMAGAMVGSVAAMQKLFPVTEHYGRLTLHLYNGESMWWEYTSPVPAIGPWKRFLRWYHGRPESDCFVMRHREGSDMVRRVDIRSYEIRQGEREKKK